jgi:YidC/Oxa1 family membrane protein insertase
MMWVIPLGVLASGLLFNFPLGVLLYWLTSNLWSLAQQGYINRFHPPTDEPGGPANHPAVESASREPDPRRGPPAKRRADSAQAVTSVCATVEPAGTVYES